MPEKPTHLFALTGEAVTVYHRDRHGDVWFRWPDGVRQVMLAETFGAYFEPLTG